MKKLIFLFSAVSLLWACKPESEITVLNPNNPNATTISSIIGRVTDEQGLAVPSANVIVEGKNVKTNAQGYFTITNASTQSSRTYITTTANGFFENYTTATTAQNGNTIANIRLVKRTLTSIFESNAGALVNVEGKGSIDFKANSFVTANGSAYNGKVNIYAYYIDPTDASMQRAPADLLAQNTNGETQVLESYGMMRAEMTDNAGNKLQLAPGTVAELKFTIPSTLQAKAKNNIPLWYFDTKLTQWKEEGSATRVGNEYVGKVSHFTPWNCDQPYPPATLKIKVVECKLLKLEGVTVTIDGYYKKQTNSDGEIEIKVRSNEPVSLEIFAEDNYGIYFNNYQQITMGEANSTKEITLQVVCSSKIIGNIQDCDGKPIDGFVTFVGNNGYTAYTQSIASAFVLNVASNTTGKLTVYNADFTYFTEIDLTTSPDTSVLVKENVKLCDKAAPQENDLKLTSSGYNADCNFVEGSIYETDSTGNNYYTSISIKYKNKTTNEDFNVYCSLYALTKAGVNSTSNFNVNISSQNFNLYMENQNMNYTRVGNKLSGKITGKINYNGQIVNVEANFKDLEIQ